MTKTITLTKQTICGYPLLYSGETRKRKLGSRMFNQRNQYLKPVKLEVTPKASIQIFSWYNKENPRIHINYYLEEKNKNHKSEKDNYARYEQKLGLYLGSDSRDYIKPVFLNEIGKLDSLEELPISKGKKLTLEEMPIVKGRELISAYRTFELLNKSTKIPTQKEWKRGSLDGVWLGVLEIYNYSSKIVWSKVYETFCQNQPKIDKKFAKKILRKTGISKTDYENILNLYPVDDNGKEIRENDLVRIISEKADFF